MIKQSFLFVDKTGLSHANQTSVFVLNFLFFFLICVIFFLTSSLFIFTSFSSLLTCNTFYCGLCQPLYTLSQISCIYTMHTSTFCDFSLLQPNNKVFLEVLVLEWLATGRSATRLNVWISPVEFYQMRHLSSFHFRQKQGLRRESLRTHIWLISYSLQRFQPFPETKKKLQFIDWFVALNNSMAGFK